jgi:hypothetical protein
MAKECFTTLWHPTWQKFLLLDSETQTKITVNYTPCSWIFLTVYMNSNVTFC